MSRVPLAKIVIVCGPTASGKSDLALRLAETVDGEIVNADSMQLYRGMDIGTAKPTRRQQQEVRHHLIDLVAPDQPFSAADFATAADAAIADIVGRGKRAIVVGGTGLYLRALVKGLVESPGGGEAVRDALQNEAAQVGNEAMLAQLRRVDPDLAAELHPNNLVRIIRALEVFRLTGVPLSRHQRDHGFSSCRYDALQIAVDVARPVLYGRIEQRVDRMVEEGLLDEVARLLVEGYARELKSMGAIGYKEAVAHLCGEIPLAEAVRLIKRNTRHYAKRQLTWFRGEPEIIWFEYPEKFATIQRQACDFFQ